MDQQAAACFFLSFKLINGTILTDIDGGCRMWM